MASHQKCEKFQKFLLEEFDRLFSMNSDLSKKQSSTNEKLVLALEKADRLDYEVTKLRDELAQYHFYEFDL